MPDPKPASTEPKTPKRRLRRPTDELRATILAAAASVFRDHGYVGATTSAIAQKADVTEAQIFRYFSSKAELFRESVFDPFDEQLRLFLDQHPIRPYDETQLRPQSAMYIDALYGLLKENAGYMRTLMLTKSSEQTLGTSTIESLQTYFERGEATMRRNQAYKVDAKLLVRVSFAAVLGNIIFADWLYPPGVAGDDEIQKAVTEFVLDGVHAALG